jgi:hypothetical protein
VPFSPPVLPSAWLVVSAELVLLDESLPHALNPKVIATLSVANAAIAIADFLLLVSVIRSISSVVTLFRSRMQVDASGRSTLRLRDGVPASL